MIKPIPMRDSLLEAIWDRMKIDSKIYFICADFGSPVLDKIRTDFPHRFINVGIAEQNLINISAGLALEGYTVFAYAIAPFITMRCYEQIRVNLALLSTVRQMNVNLIGVGAGYSYSVSGPTHQCYEDITIMRALPNLRIMSPSDHLISASLVDECLSKHQLKYIRLDAQVLPTISGDSSQLTDEGFNSYAVGGGDVCLIATGYMTHTAINLSKILLDEGVKVGVIDLIDLTDFSRKKLLTELGKYNFIVSLEEGFKGRGGVDSILFNLFSQNQLNKKYLNIGIEGGYSFELGTREELHEKVGIGKIAVLAKIKNFIHAN